MWTISIWMFAVMLALNGCIIYVDNVMQSEFGITMLSPFDGGVVSATTQPNIYNATSQSGTLYGNITDVRNSTSNNPFNFFTESLYWSLGLLQLIYNFLGGGFLWNAIAIFGIPELFLASAFYVVLGFFTIITAAHIITNRFT